MSELNISCDICQLNVNGLCSEVKKVLCDDFRAIPYISEEDKALWPDYGGATALRFNDGSPYKKNRKIY